MIILSFPFRFFERIRFRKKIREAEVGNPVFILGHPRSGTTYLHYLLGKDPAFGYCSTIQAMLPHFFLSSSRIFSKMISGALPEKRPMDNLKMGVTLPKEEEFALSGYGPESLVTGYYFPRNFIKNLRKNVLFEDGSGAEKNWKKNFNHFLKKLAFANPGKRLLLKSPANTARVQEILSLYPDAKFIHIYRNPYDVFQSHLHLFKKLLPMLSFHEVSDADLEEITFATYIGIHEKFFREKHLIPKENLVEVRYEDFITSPIKHLESIYRNLSLPGFENAKHNFEQEIHTYHDYNKNKFTLSDELAGRIRDRFGFAFEKFGYDNHFRRG